MHASFLGEISELFSQGRKSWSERNIT